MAAKKMKKKNLRDRDMDKKDRKAKCGHEYMNRTEPQEGLVGEKRMKREFSNQLRN